jgi:hypothetical protein
MKSDEFITEINWQGIGQAAQTATGAAAPYVQKGAKFLGKALSAGVRGVAGATGRAIQRSGLLGATSQTIARDKQRQEQIKQVVIANFVNKLKIAFDTISSNLSETITFNDYDLTNILLESYINNLEENNQYDLATWLTDFIENEIQVNGYYPLSPQEESVKNNLINEFATEYPNTKKFPMNTAKKLGAWFYNVAVTHSALAKKNERSLSQNYHSLNRPPDQQRWAKIAAYYNQPPGSEPIIRLDSDNKNYQYSFADNSWVDMQSKYKVTDTNKLSELNVEYNKRYAYRT